MYEVYTTIQRQGKVDVAHTVFRINNHSITQLMHQSTPLQQQPLANADLYKMANYLATMQIDRKYYDHIKTPNKTTKNDNTK